MVEHLVDVVTEIDIDCPRAEVAAYASDPDNATAWYQNIRQVEWRTPKPTEVGSRIAFVASFLGRKLAYTYEVVELVPSERFVMRTADGPFAMDTTYAWEDTPEGATGMTLKNRGQPSGSHGSEPARWPRPCGGRTARTWPGSRRSWRRRALSRR